MHSDFYKKNRTYAERLRDRDPREFQSLPSVCSASSFHEKYIQALGAARIPESVIVDVGCGAGQVVRALTDAGLQGHGVDVSEEMGSPMPLAPSTCSSMSRSRSACWTRWFAC
jgi:2-polyprenyl-3-methyl-5-hydroxy-6-metoxy-1,4-benzoquinol methylase